MTIFSSHTILMNRAFQQLLNSYFDLSMFRVSDVILGTENSLKMVINPKSEELEKCADAFFNG